MLDNMIDIEVKAKVANAVIDENADIEKETAEEIFQLQFLSGGLIKSWKQLGVTEGEKVEYSEMQVVILSLIENSTRNISKKN